jgi:small-conductance mechanosensitive channel/CRP-like cAMP-binding protein
MTDLIGFALLGGSALAALACLLAWRNRGPARGIRLGLSLVVFFLVTRIMAERLLPGLMAGPPALRLAAEQGLAALCVLAAAFTADQALRHWLWYGRLGDGTRSHVPNILIGLASLAGYAATLLLIAATIFGLDVTAVAATSGVLAIVLGVSAQQTLGQVFAGLALNASRPFRKGDSLQIDGVWGVLVDADWRAVTLRTYEGTLVTLPNMLVASARLTNLDAPTHDLRHHIPFVADAEVPPGRVQAVARAALLGCPHVLAEPEPLVLLKNFEERGIAYEAIFWHRDPNLYILRRDEAGQALWYAFRRAGIALAVNRLLLGAPAPAAGDAQAAEHDRLLAGLPGILARSRLFAGVPDAEIAALAGRARPRLFAAGERLMREGEPGDSLFVVLDGEVSVRLQRQDGAETEVYRQGVGEVFGHMSAMTGAPRFATVRATRHLLAAELDRATLAPLIAGHPEVVEAVAREILRLEATQQGLRQQAMTTALNPGGSPSGLLDRVADRIRAFFAEAR